MHLTHLETAFFPVWALSVLIVGVASHVTSGVGLSLLAALALVPPLILLSVWREPVPAMTESVRQGRR